ncbi:tryptophan halogenase family protein [Sphingorhabdus arenilitoris]|uniref:Tryptophan halogenase family protein n=1 Tax=Sphingorhabdus arenilitoris TaxID=1490041 RepID=A0ABV8RKF3_9SPHN
MRDIVIAGGGTAGWMAAAAFARFLGGGHNVTLVESDAIGTVGVGEATIPQIQNFNNALGIDEAEFLKATQGSYKLGIEFDGWSAPGKKYIHAFGQIGRQLGFVPFHHYVLRDQQRGGARDLWSYSPTAIAAAQNRFSPVQERPGQMPSGTAWAYHFDAGLYAAFLRRYAEDKGVKRIEGKIAEAQQQEGRISALRLDDGRQVGGDFFIDCTGFAALLIGGAMESGFDDWSDLLPCNRAAAVQCEAAFVITPYTRSSARAAGWQWRIPLQHRTGNGHVYCSDFMSDDEAASILLSHLDGAAIGDPRLIKFTTGMRRDSWKSNVVALGLAAGFMEPLESTSIHLVQSAIERILQFFPGDTDAAADIEEYNRRTQAEWLAIRDFLILHYHRNGRSEAFWEAGRKTDIPKSLARRLALFESSGRIMREGDELFTEVGWLQVMTGQGVTPQSWHPMAGQISDGQLTEFLGLAAQHANAQADKMIPHNQWIEQYCKSDAGHRMVA